HTRYLNHQLPRMLHTIGFDKVYERAEGAHFWAVCTDRTPQGKTGPPTGEAPLQVGSVTA
ncbi:hypothetical protein ABZ661_21755, partial [Streptomyces sp. NPDC007057]|uniref:hypothetical protein n=1 Tax=Streptomyces sp. NPDC007057 TaxID=3154586 RepID=UPI0033D16143